MKHVSETLSCVKKRSQSYSEKTRDSTNWRVSLVSGWPKPDITAGEYICVLSSSDISRTMKILKAPFENARSTRCKIPCFQTRAYISPTLMRARPIQLVYGDRTLRKSIRINFWTVERNPIAQQMAWKHGDVSAAQQKKLPAVNAVREYWSYSTIRDNETWSWYRRQSGCSVDTTDFFRGKGQSKMWRRWSTINQVIPVKSVQLA